MTLLWHSGVRLLQRRVCLALRSGRRPPGSRVRCARQPSQMQVSGRYRRRQAKAIKSDSPTDEMNGIMQAQKARLLQRQVRLARRSRRRLPRHPSQMRVPRRCMRGLPTPRSRRCDSERMRQHQQCVLCGPNRTPCCRGRTRASAQPRRGPLARSRCTVVLGCLHGGCCACHMRVTLYCALLWHLLHG